MAAATTDAPMETAPEQQNQDIHLYTGWQEHTVTQTYLGQEAISDLTSTPTYTDVEMDDPIAPPPPSTFKPTIYQVKMDDMKLVISRENILKACEGAKAWYPISASFEITDIRCVQVNPVTGGTELIKDIDQISVNIFKTTASRGICNNDYMYDMSDKELHSKYEKYRTYSDQGIHKKGILRKTKYEDFHNGMAASIGTDGRMKWTKLDIPIKSSQWNAQFNKPEVPNFGGGWKGDISMLRHIYELADPALQEVDLYYKQSAGSTAWPWKVKNELIKVGHSKAKAIVVYPFPYTSGLIQHGVGQQSPSDWAVTAKTAGTWVPVERGIVSGESNPTSSNNYDCCAPGFKPVMSLHSPMDTDTNWLPTNVPAPNSTYDNNVQRNYPSMQNWKDMLYVYEQTAAEASPAILDIRTGRISADRSIRGWPATQPFSSEKGMETTSFYFDPVQGGMQSRNVHFQYKYTVTYSFATYHMDNPVDAEQLKALNLTKGRRAQNMENYGQPIFQTKKLIDPVTREEIDATCAYQRMYIAKPIMHFYDIPAPVEIPKPL